MPVPGTAVPDRIAADFEIAVRTNKEAMQALFDFEAVGEYEILLHRYDLYGRVELDEHQKAVLAAEDGTPYPVAREQRNIGNFYPRWVQPTIGTGGCTLGPPKTYYGKRLGDIEPLQAGTPPGYQVLFEHATEWLASGGVVRVQCTGGTGGIALVWTKRDNARGYDLITMYKD